MGLDLRGGRLAVGTRSQILEFHDVPSLLPKMQPPGKHDACFVPRRSHYTGDIRIHDVAYVGDELWFVATRFSCLATLDDEHSFVPRWRPPFVSALAAEDRCHLNGLCVIDDEVRYVTALGTTDEARGWRQNKARGGIVMDVPSSEVVAPGLSMPHSPTWYRDKLWVLESGEGSIGHVDLDTGRVETVAQLPGFTRGLSFAGPLAFVGLSEVRESATFGGIPLPAGSRSASAASGWSTSRPARRSPSSASRTSSRRSSRSRCSPGSASPRSPSTAPMPSTSPTSSRTRRSGNG